MKKANIKKMIESVKKSAMKGGVKVTRESGRINIDYCVDGAKDMRQHAVDIGAHGAKEYFGR